MKALKIDADQLMTALEDCGNNIEWYLDRKTGEVVPLATFDDLEEEETLRYQMDEEPERFVFIEPVPASAALRAIRDFLDTVSDEQQRRELESTLNDSPPFHRYRDRAMALPEIRERWVSFRNNFYLEQARLWLQGTSINAELTAPEHRI